MTLSHPEVVGEDQGARQDAQAMFHILRMFTIRGIEMDAFYAYAFGIPWEGKGGGAHVANIGPPTELLKVPLSGLLNL